jgi:hypothetical protein
VGREVSDTSNAALFVFMYEVQTAGGATWRGNDRYAP